MEYTVSYAGALENALEEVRKAELKASQIRDKIAHDNFGHIMKQNVKFHVKDFPIEFWFVYHSYEVDNCGRVEFSIRRLGKNNNPTARVFTEIQPCDIYDIENY